MTASAPQPTQGECQNCYCINTLVAAITTNVASLYCRACGHVFEVETRDEILPVTIDPLNTWRCADIMLEHYGEHAPEHVTRRISELNTRGDLQGAARWADILAAIAAVRARKPPPEAMTR